MAAPVSTAEPKNIPISKQTKVVSISVNAKMTERAFLHTFFVFISIPP